ncbi:7-deoxyloganetin glucosyltransferase [Beta vulgaris subsp. vulgaris]|uniref:7-deoxyloganetin glucosyltransferase n=1 Tax=Beta vulgaris subsp. vulgaris TaxID=3555 RepID=UPI0020371FCB|nr:7-deoxyloganetin glucosyltransferase [Beta vulgaris subsp. vulgaris]
MSIPKEGHGQKPHAVCIPYPAQGHINPMLQLAKIFHFKGFHITFVNSEYNHSRLLRSRGPTALADRPSFRFKTIPDGLPPMDADSTQDISLLCASTDQHCLGPFKELIAHLNEAGDVPPVSCIVSDVSMFFTLNAAQEFGVPEVMLWTASACGLLGYAQYPKLVEMGLVPFKDASFITNGELDAVVDWVPGMEDMQLRDIPSFIRTTNPNDIMLNFVQRLLHKSKQASAIVFNSFDALDHAVLNSLSSDFPPLYTLGPLQLLLDSIPGSNDEEIQTISTNLWKEDKHCLGWLDSYEPNSVVYVNFGSITVMTNDQLIEFAWGLANSNQPFLWIIRPDLVIGDSAVLPPEFIEETKNRGLIASWCNQDQVLAHPAVGGFLTHCGWNSIIETLINGAPIICWPFFAEQQTNCWLSCNKWGIGMEIDVNVKRSEVERQVRELMDGEKGKEMKRKVMEWRKLGHEATAAPNGSSYKNLDKVIKVLGY